MRAAVIRSFLRGALDDRCAAAIPRVPHAQAPTRSRSTPRSPPRSSPAPTRATSPPRRDRRGRGLRRRDRAPPLLVRQPRTGPARRPFTVRDERFTLRDVRFVRDASGQRHRHVGSRDRDGRRHAAVGAVTARVRWSQATPLATVTIGDRRDRPRPVGCAAWTLSSPSSPGARCASTTIGRCPTTPSAASSRPGRLAGSSKNRQARRFVVLTDRVAVAEAIWNPENALGAALLVAIVVGGKGPLALDAGRAAQNMLLAAHSEGIGSCPNGIADADAAARAVGVEEGEQVVAILSFGYPARPVDAERRSRRGVDRARRSQAVRRRRFRALRRSAARRGRRPRRAPRRTR